MPSNNVQLEYSQIDAVSAQLKSAVDNINPQLLALKQSVDTLLADGLFLQQTSPALQTSYQQFTDQLSQIVAKIADFANQFKGIKETIETMDTTMANQINSSK